MMLRFAIRSLFLICLLLIFGACGGGGGSGGASGSSSKDGIRVLNAVLETAAIDLVSQVDAKVLASQVRFSFASSYGSLKEGNQAFSLLEHNRGGILSSTTAEILAGKSYSILYYGNRSLGFRSRLIDDSTTFELESGQAAIRLVHTLQSANSLRLSVAGASQLASYGFASEYLQLSSGLNNLELIDSQGRIIYNGAFELEDGKIYSLFISGRREDRFIVRLV